MTIIAIVEEAFFEAQENKTITNSNMQSSNQEQATTGARESETSNLAKPERPSDQSSQPQSSHTPIDGSYSFNSSSNTNNSMMGKRDLPEHLKYLLKNVDRSSAAVNNTTGK